MSKTVELPIQQSTWEIYGDKVAFNSKEFQTNLHKYEVRDLLDPKLTIKQDKDKYIFAINGENKFAVNNKVDLITFMQDFYKDLAKNESRDEQKKAVIQVSEFEKKTKIEVTYTETAKDLAELADQIRKNENIEKNAINIKNVKFKVERLTAFFEQEKDLTNSEKSGWIFNTKYDRKDKGLRNMQKTEIKRRLKELNKIQKQINELEDNKDKKYSTKDRNGEDKKVKMDDINKLDRVMTLKQFSGRIEELGKEVPDFILSRNSILLEQGDTTPYFEVIGYDRSDAKKLNKAFKKINNEYAILDELKLQGAKRQELSQDLQDMEKYLNKVINEPNTFKPSEHPFVPTHTKEFFELMKIKPTPEQLKELNKVAGETSSERNKTDKTNTITEQEVTQGERTGNKEQMRNNYNTAKDAFEKWGINRLSRYWIDQTNMKPEQKEFWAWAGNLAITWGAIFLGWKMLSSAFKMAFKSNKEKKTGIYDGSNRARLGIPVGLTFWANARKGEGLSKMFTWGAMTEKIGEMFGGAASSAEANKQSPQEKETRITLTEWFPGATALFNGLNYGEMKKLLIKDGDRLKVDPAQYDSLLDMFKTGSKKNETAAAFLEKSVGKDDNRHVIDLALKWMWITMDDLTKKPDGKFNEDTAAPALGRLATVVQLMKTGPYNKMNSETQYLVDNYIAGDKTNDLDDLEKRGDIFYKEVEIKDQTWLASKAKELANGNIQKEQNILLALNTFYDNMPTSNKKIELIGKWPEVTFKTYDQETSINLDKKTIPWFSANKEFTSYYETFKAASLTNYIKKVCKEKIAVKDKPFYLSAGRDITFDNAKIFSTDFDTEIISGGWRGALQEVSPTLEANKQAYCDYLNSVKFWKETPSK